MKAALGHSDTSSPVPPGRVPRPGESRPDRHCFCPLHPENHRRGRFSASQCLDRFALAAKPHFIEKFLGFLTGGAGSWFPAAGTQTKGVKFKTEAAKPMFHSRVEQARHKWRHCFPLVPQPVGGVGWGGFASRSQCLLGSKQRGRSLGTTNVCLVY